MTDQTEQQEIEDIAADLRARKITAGAFQKAANVSAATWHRIKGGLINPNTATMRRIREAHGKIKDGANAK